MKCLACGAEIEFSPKDRNLKCSYCGSIFEPKDYREKITAAKEYIEIEEPAGEQIETKSYMCKQCGGRLLTFDDTAVTFCSYCGSSNVLEAELYKEEAPEYVIPFKITKEECEKIYKKEIKKHFFAPKEMLDDVVIKKFRGIYMPYGVYKAVHTGNAINFGEKYSHHSCNYDYYDQYRITSAVEAEYNGISYDLSANFFDKISQAIAPFDFNEAQKFNVSYLSGYYADSRDVKKELYEYDAKAIIGPDTTKELKKHKEFRKYGCTSPALSYIIRDKKIAYYPVYFLAVRNKKNDAVNYAVINGQTGKIAVELPVDIKKYLIFTLILAVLIFIPTYMVATFTPQIMIIVSFVFSTINLTILCKQIRQLKEREMHTNDKGYISVQKKDENIEKKSRKISDLKKKVNPGIVGIIISMIMSISILLLNPISDIDYYLVATVTLVITLYSFKEIIDKFNQLTSRKLSQIGIRGGDESEI